MWEWLTAIPLLRMLPFRRLLIVYRTHAVQARIRLILTCVSSNRDLEADRLMFEPCYCDHKLMDHQFRNHEFGMRIVCAISNVTCLMVQPGDGHEIDELRTIGVRIESRYQSILGSNTHEIET